MLHTVLSQGEFIYFGTDKAFHGKLISTAHKEIEILETFHFM